MDILTPEQRSALMGRIRGRDTGPEMAVRRLLWALGFRYRTHAKDLPGRPDIVFRSERIAIFVHGCFWHRHDCGLAYSPKSRPEFWARKFEGNLRRDSAAQQALRSAGWRVMVIWECQTKRPVLLARRLTRFIQRSSRKERKKIKQN
jgi:DNA mismatch endonuclease (patch repair protein)